MFGNRNKPETGITLIASNCEINGDIHFSDQLQVNGTVNGNLVAREGSKASVTISEKGRVVGEVRVPNVVVNGKVEGDIYSSQHIELAAKAEIRGNVYYNLIEMVMGSCVEGKLVHCVPEAQATAAADEGVDAEKEQTVTSGTARVTAFHGSGS